MAHNPSWQAFLSTVGADKQPLSQDILEISIAEACNLRTARATGSKGYVHLPLK
tara:strand:- start:397 stop:558 length:162 start_codon:yes stop_codon:yes gene_type:complete